MGFDALAEGMSPTATVPPSDLLLCVEALTVVLHRVQGPEVVLRDVSFTVASGEAVALVGETSAGLPELLLTMLGLLPDQLRPRVTGSVRIAGKPLARSAALRNQVGVMFRDDPMLLDPNVRAGRQLARRARRRRDIPGLLASAGLDAKSIDLLAYPHQLSTEQRQRLMLALALARHPALLVLEEPGAGLDAVGRAALLRTIAAIRDRGTTAILLLTADVAAAAAVTRRAAVLHAGRVVETGQTADLLARPAHPLTEAIVNAPVRLTADRGQRLLPVVLERVVSGAARTAASEGCAFRGPCPAGSNRCAQLPPLGPAGLHGGQVACWNVNSPARRPPPPPRWQPLGPSAVAPVLRLDEVSFRFAERPRSLALSGIGLRIGDRETIAIVGSTGAGKSTLLRIAAGLLRPSSGRRAYPSTGLPQMLQPNPLAALPPWRTVGDIVGERISGRGLSNAERVTRIEEALALAQLQPELAAARPADLNQAQAQRVGIARALISPPSLLLCDEPLGLLEGRAAAAVLNLLAGLRRTMRLAMLYATDDLAAARYLADRIIVLEDGKIVEQGPADSIAFNPQSRTGRALRDLAIARAAFDAVGAP